MAESKHTYEGRLKVQIKTTLIIRKILVMLRTITTAWRKEMSQRRKVWKEIHVLNISPI